jgi:hypothetical protein
MTQSIQKGSLTAVLREALELADATLRGANMDRSVVERKISAALAKARKYDGAA